MRLIGALKTDMKFQYKQGFYTVYVLLTLMYMFVIQRIPEGIVREYTVPLVVFSDPSLLGFFFIGGIIMLEKQQGVIDYLAVTPLSPGEYLMSKSLSLGIVSIAASFMITFAAHRGMVNWGLLFLGVFLTSIFFTLYGFIAAAGCRTMNQYFIKMIPYVLLAVLPCLSLIGFEYSTVLEALPNVAGLILILGAFRGMQWYFAALYGAIMLIWIAVIFGIALKVYHKKILYGGGTR